MEPISPAEDMIAPFMLRRGFLWQHSFPPFVVDFYHPRLKLVVEVDGRFHAQQREQDEERNRILIERYHVKIYRIRAQDCFNGSYWRRINLLVKQRTGKWV
jgi:very-short-patch-repair endonuclease